ncbi:MAG: TetR/AcrR family transcriptional regulator [Bacteroidia bacterium]|nr:TetR/AcrR family transcriptional regulator [Bacteroidia bacterium]MDW8416938.1 TetR/AcrR family transcriptional regulator [Bacteroidia bacterium]
MDAAERIREAAIQEFAQYGYDGARLERIARAAGVHTAQIHYYFRNKRFLYEAVQKALTPPSLEDVLTPLKDMTKTLPERIQGFYERFYSAIESMSSLSVESSPNHRLPAILLSPRPLHLPEWIEALRSAQSFGLIKPLQVELILTYQWSIALMPLWFSVPKNQWADYYLKDAPKLFWETVKGV